MLLKKKFYSILNTFIWIIIYRCMLDYLYFSILTNYYSYQGLINNQTDNSCFLSWFVLVLSFLLFIPLVVNENKRLSTTIIILLYYLSFVPFTTCINAGIITYGYLLYNNVYWFFLIITQMISIKIQILPIQINILGDKFFNKQFIRLVGIFFLVVVVYISGKYTKFRLNTSIINIYGIRAEVDDYNMPTILLYLFYWSKSINPLMLGICLINNNKIMFIIYFVVQMLSFGVDGLKSTFFMPFLVLILFFNYDLFKLKKINFISIKIITIVKLLSIIETIITKTNFICNILLRRLLFLPNLIGNYYYDYFSINQADYFKSSFLRFFGLKSNYQNNGGISHIIGSKYFSQSVNANNGLASDAVANLGILGCVVMPILIVFVLRLYDKSTISLDNRLTIPFSIYFAILLMSTSLTTILMTHGLFIVIILFALLSHNFTQKDNNCE